LVGLLKEVHLQSQIAILGLEAVFEMPKQETRKSQRELTPARTVDVMQLARHCYRKTIFSLLLYIALHYPQARSSSFDLSLHADSDGHFSQFGGDESREFT
jgi:hypothetical protein